MKIETDSSLPVETVVAQVDAGHLLDEPQVAFGSVWEETIATANTQVLHGWLRGGRSSTRRGGRGDFA